MRFIVALLALLVSASASAQQRHQTFKNASGQTIGRSVTDASGRTTFYNERGRNNGRSVTSNGTTTVYDNLGRRSGTVMSR